MYLRTAIFIFSKTIKEALEEALHHCAGQAGRALRSVAVGAAALRLH
jgi:hypothetical protein